MKSAPAAAAAAAYIEYIVYMTRVLLHKKNIIHTYEAFLCISHLNHFLVFEHCSLYLFSFSLSLPFCVSISSSRLHCLPFSSVFVAVTAAVARRKNKATTPLYRIVSITLKFFHAVVSLPFLVAVVGYLQNRAATWARLSCTTALCCCFSCCFCFYCLFFFVRC